MAIDEAASTFSLVPKVCVVPEKSKSVARREGEECVQDFLDHLNGEKSAARFFVLGGEADDNDGFVDITCGITAVGDAESEGWTFGMRWHVKIHQWKRWQRVLSTHLVCLHVSLPSSFPISF